MLIAQYTQCETIQCHPFVQSIMSVGLKQKAEIYLFFWKVLFISYNTDTCTQ